MTVLTVSNALPGIPMPQHTSGQSSVQNFNYPGALQPVTTVTVLLSSEALLGIPMPQHVSGQTSVQNFRFPGALQPAIAVGVLLSQTHFRFRTDTGAVDATPTWGDAEDAA